MQNSPINFNDPSGHARCDEEGNCWEGNRRTNNSTRFYAPRSRSRLKQELENFIAPEKVQETEMEPVSFFGQTIQVTPGEYRLLLNSNGKIDNWKLLRMGSIFQAALNHTEALFPMQQQRNSQADAFRHAYWNALITHEFGYDYALAFTSAHETDPNAERPEQFMDLHNNEVGRQIALANPEMRPEHIQREILKALYNGDLYVWDGKDIYFSNQCPSCLGSGY